jgi:hypothetical protein
MKFSAIAAALLWAGVASANGSMVHRLSVAPSFQNIRIVALHKGQPLPPGGYHIAANAADGPAPTCYWMCRKARARTSVR